MLQPFFTASLLLLLPLQSASGTGLAFIMFTEAVLSMPGSQVWAVLFFIMLFFLGLSSMFGNVEGVLSPLKDLKVVPSWMPDQVVIGEGRATQDVLLCRKHAQFFNLAISTGLQCMVSFAVALIFTQGSGNYWVEVFNGYVGSVPLLIIALFEIIGVIFVYGMKK